MKRLILAITILFTLPLSVYAQTPTSDLESCFTYYDYGQIQTHLSTTKSTYTSGEELAISGTIVHSGRRPLRDVILYAQLRRVNAQSHLQNGHHLIDRLTLLKDLSFLPGETKPVSVKFPLLQSYPTGDYQLQYFLLSKEGFHYGGRPFLEEDTAGYSNFTLSGNTQPMVYFDPTSLKVNGAPYPIRSLTTQFAGEPLRFSANLVREGQQSSIPLTISWYSFEDSLEDYLISREKTTLSAGTQTVETIFTPPHPGAFVMVMEVDTPVRSLLKYRFAQKGSASHALRMNDLGVTNFSADSQKDRAYVCFHSPSDAKTPPTEVSLSLLDGSKQVLETKTITQAFDFNVRAISLPLTKLADPKNFWLKARFSQPGNPSLTQEVEKHFDCQTFAANQTAVNAEYDSQSNSLVLKATSICGKPLSQGYIEQVRIVKDGKIVDEAYNLTDLNKKFPQKPLSPGDYEAQIQSGEEKKIIKFSLAGTKERKLNPWILVLISTVVILGIGGFLLKKRRESQGAS